VQEDNDTLGAGARNQSLLESTGRHHTWSWSLEPKLLECAKEDNILGAGAWNQSCLKYAKEDNILGAGALNHKVSSTSKSCIL
jgi:hypothetical protein